MTMPIAWLRWLVTLRRHPSAFLLIVQLAGILLYPVMEDTQAGRALFGAFGILVLALALWVVNRSAAVNWIAWSLAVPSVLLSLSAALQAGDLVTPVSLRLLRAGEQSGNVGQMMERSADFYDEEISRWIEWFVRLFEPLLMTFIGLLIGVIVILMYIPIFELASSIH